MIQLKISKSSFISVTQALWIAGRISYMRPTCQQSRYGLKLPPLLKTWPRSVRKPNRTQSFRVRFESSHPADSEHTSPRVSSNKLSSSNHVAAIWSQWHWIRGLIFSCSHLLLLFVWPNLHNNLREEVFFFFLPSGHCLVWIFFCVTSFRLLACVSVGYMNFLLSHISPQSSHRFYHRYNHRG